MAEFGLVEAKRAMGIWGRHHMEAWVMDGTTDYKSSKYNHDPSMNINYESSNYKSKSHKVSKVMNVHV